MSTFLRENLLHTRRSTSRRLNFEALEDRRLMSAHMFRGALVVDGTVKSDVIDIALNDSTLTVTLNGKVQNFSTAGILAIAVQCGNGNDNITGSAIDDLLIGGGGNDVIHGGGGDDNLFGQGGDDQLYGDDGNDHLSGGNGNDDLQGGADNDDLKGDKGVDHLAGGTGDDLCEGGAGNNLLEGNEGRDIFTSHQGDTLTTNVEDDLDADGFRVQDNETELEMTLRSGPIMAKVKFNSETEDGGVSRSFRVDVFGGNPKAPLTVKVGGVNVGTITILDDGRGTFQLSDSGGSMAFPDNFPMIVPGVVINVGPASGKVKA